jgi:hypothetical protein
MGIFNRQYELASIYRKNLLVNDSDDSVICKLSEAVNSGVKIYSSTGRIGTGEVKLQLDWDLIDTRYMPRSVGGARLLGRYSNASGNGQEISLASSLNLDSTYGILSVSEGNVNHNNLLNFVANKHIDHSAVSISGSNGLSGGGDLTSSRTISHSNGSWPSPATLSGSNVISNLSVDSYGHITNWSTRSLSYSDVGAASSSHNHSGVYQPLEDQRLGTWCSPTFAGIATTGDVYMSAGVFQIDTIGLQIRINNNGSYYGAIGTNALNKWGLGYSTGSNFVPTVTWDTGGNIVATSFSKSGGLSTQFLMADGSVSTGSSITGLTTNYHSKWNGSTLVDSMISDDGTSMYLGNTFGRLRLIQANSCNYIQSANYANTGSLPLCFTGLSGNDGIFNFTGSIFPSVGGSYSLGGSSADWSNVYTRGVSSNTGILSIPNDINLGWADRRFEIFYSGDYRIGMLMEANNRALTLYANRADGACTSVKLQNGSVTLLDVNGAFGYLSGSYNSGNPYYTFNRAGGVDRVAIYADNTIRFITNSTEVSRFTTTGAYLMGGDASDVQFKVGHSNLASYWALGRDNITTGDFIFKNATTERVRFLASGAVNVSTSASSWGFNASTNSINWSGIWFSGHEGEVILRGADGAIGTRINAGGSIAYVGNNNILHAGNYASYSNFSGIVTAGTGQGFQNLNYQAGYNRIWSFGTSSQAYGMAYYQGASTSLGTDGIGFHFGDTANPKFWATNFGSAFLVPSATNGGFSVIGSASSGYQVGYSFVHTTAGPTGIIRYDNTNDRLGFYNYSTWGGDGADFRWFTNGDQTTAKMILSRVGNLTVSGVSYLNAANGVESINTAGIRGTNNGVEQLNIYNRLAIGYSAGWNTFPSAPIGGIRTAGSAIFDGNLSVGTTYAGFAANIAGTTYVIGGHVWVNDGYSISESSGVSGIYPHSTAGLTFKAVGNNRLTIGAAGNLSQGLVTRPNAVWGATGATGAVVIRFPGGGGNYSMVHAVIDIYEYNGNNACTVIVGGHNWGNSWYNYGANLVGYTDKQIRVAFKDGQYCIVIGDSSSTWSYGQVVLRKLQIGAYYAGIMDINGAFTIAQESDSYTWVSGNLSGLRTTSFNSSSVSTGAITATTGSYSGAISVASTTGGTSTFWGAVSIPQADLNLTGNFHIGNATGRFISFDYSSWTQNAYIGLSGTFDLLIQGHSNINFRTNHLNGDVSNRLQINNSGVFVNGTYLQHNGSDVITSATIAYQSVARATYLNPISGPTSYLLAYAADSARTNAGEWGRVVMYYVPTGGTYGVRVDRADYADTSGNAATATNVAWSGVTSKPTTLGGYGITDWRWDSYGGLDGVSGQSGCYYFAGNSPIPGQSDGTLWYHAYPVAPTTWGSQLVQDYRTGRVYVRGRNAGTWSGWLTGIDSGNIGSQSVSYASTATLASTCAIYTDRTDATWYQAMWATSGGTTLYATPNVSIYSGGYGGIGFYYNSYTLMGNPSYGIICNTGISAAALYESGTRVSLAGHGHDYAVHRGEGTNFIDYAYGLYDAYRGGWRTSNDLYVAYAYNSGNAATATALQTPRTINGVAFDGTSNITISAAPSSPINNHQAASGVSDIVGTGSLIDMQGMDITYTPKGNNAMVLFNAPFSVTANGQPVTITIYVTISGYTYSYPSITTNIFSNTQAVPAQRLVAVTPGVSTRIWIKWLGSTAVHQYGNTMSPRFLTILDLP